MFNNYLSGHNIGSSHMDKESDSSDKHHSLNKFGWGKQISPIEIMEVIKNIDPSKLH